MGSWSKKPLGNRWLRLLSIVSRLLGVSPASSKYRHVHLVWSLILLSWIWFVCTSLLVSKSQMQVLAIEKLMYLIEYPSNMIITAIFSLYVYRSASFFESQAMQQFKLQKLLFVDAWASQEFYNQLGNYVFKLLLMVFGFHGICVTIDILWLNFNWLLTLYSNCAHNLVGLMISLSLLQYVVALRGICLLLQQLNLRLEQLQPSRNSICILSPSTAEFEHKLEQLRGIVVALNDMHSQLLHRFGVVFLVSFVNSLLSFCYELFNTFRMVEQAQWEEWVLFIYRLLWLLMHGTRIWCVLIGNTRIAEQKCQLCLLLNKFHLQDPRQERAVNHFLLQLQTHDVCPSTVCGVVDLDTLAVGGFISALSAIVIFLIQIDLGNKSLMGYSF
ncbi:putative gustatory receptor 59e [Drosophila albomicans]|uniref:Gustatory receptor n=1 Tax=Drosophila albomicans TaxID=7291 RepID=A0A6P8WRT3_DROAB|nr:putative gustatory receptor 59e [Drosophila albomicans]